MTESRARTLGETVGGRVTMRGSAAFGGIVRALLVAALAALTVLALGATAGCVEVSGEDVPDWVPDWLRPQAETVSVEPTGSAGGVEGVEQPTGSHGHGVEVLMIGGEVVDRWFTHWEWDGRTSVKREGFALYRHTGPSDPASLASTAASLPADTVACFIPSPDDFEDASAAPPAHLADSARALAEAAGDAPIEVVLATAAPSVARDSDAALVERQLAYDELVRGLAAADERVHVFEMHDELAGPDGYLSKGLAVLPSDSRLNEVAYAVLDDRLFETLTALRR